MSTDPNEDKIDLLQGTLNMLVLRTLLFGPMHGHAIAHAIEHGSEEVLRLDHGSLYPALHRLVKQGLITAKSGVSENNRRAKFYSLTAKGHRALTDESTRWDRLTRAIGLIMGPAGSESES